METENVAEGFVEKVVKRMWTNCAWNSVLPVKRIPNLVEFNGTNRGWKQGGETVQEMLQEHGLVEFQSRCSELRQLSSPAGPGAVWFGGAAEPTCCVWALWKGGAAQQSSVLQLPFLWSWAFLSPAQRCCSWVGLGDPPKLGALASETLLVRFFLREKTYELEKVVWIIYYYSLEKGWACRNSVRRKGVDCSY